MVSKPDSDTLKKIISKSSEPLIFRSILNWEIRDWDLGNWQKALGDEILTYRCGKHCSSEEPQWETTTSQVQGNFDYFLKNQSNQNEWLYFDYKYLREWLLTIPELQSISWADFGFSDLGSNDSTIWIGSKGAHTPCHTDTYGCNLIAQLYGRKLWLIFPPETNLNESRIPYEESSIFSRINFFSPRKTDIKDLTKGRLIIMNPGDVLFLPNHWWHYVENLETAISINVWLPHKNDDCIRVQESLVQLLVIQLIKDLKKEELNQILIPSVQNDMLLEKNIQECLSTVKQMKEIFKSNTCKRRKTEEGQHSTDNFDTEKALANYADFIKIIPVTPKEEFLSWCENQFNRFNKINSKCIEFPKLDSNLQNLINSVLHTDVISLINNKFSE